MNSYCSLNPQGILRPREEGGHQYKADQTNSSWFDVCVHSGPAVCQLVENKESLRLPDTERTTVLQSVISDPEDLRVNHENFRSTDVDLLSSVLSSFL